MKWATRPGTLSRSLAQAARSAVNFVSRGVKFKWQASSSNTAKAKTRYGQAGLPGGGGITHQEYQHRLGPINVKTGGLAKGIENGKEPETSQ